MAETTLVSEHLSGPTQGLFTHRQLLACLIMLPVMGKYHFILLVFCLFFFPPCLLQVSKASADLMLYCEEHAKKDPLLMGIPASENPFKDKKTCILL